jgi:hypothetical protein
VKRKGKRNKNPVCIKNKSSKSTRLRAFLFSILVRRLKNQTNPDFPSKNLSQLTDRSLGDKMRTLLENNETFIEERIWIWQAI